MLSAFKVEVRIESVDVDSGKMSLSMKQPEWSGPLRSSLLLAPFFFCIGMMVRILRQLFSGWWIIVCNTGRLCQTMFEANRDLDWNNKKQWCNGDLQVHVDKLCCDLAFRCHWNDGIWIGKLCTCLYLFHGRTFHVKYCNLFRCEKIIGKWGCIPTSFPKRLFFGDERRNGRSLKFSGSWAKVFAPAEATFLWRCDSSQWANIAEDIGESSKLAMGHGWNTQSVAKKTLWGH